MAKNFASLAFTPEIKAMQEKYGSRYAYDRQEKQKVESGLTQNEIDFISHRDSFYMASIGQNGFPYIQHRGGPKGFVKVLNPNAVAFIDFSGNKQYISVGNFVTNKNVSIIMVDYPTRSRLKLYATTEIVELKNNPDLLNRLSLDGYGYKPERMMEFTIEAYDWNCPQHITPRYTAEEIEEALKPQREYIKKLEEELKALRSAS